MISTETFEDLFRYHYWARDRQLEVCASLTEDQFLRPLGGSFASLRDTLAHLVAVEWLWLERWRGRSPRSMPPAAEFPTLEAISRRWRQVETEIRQLLSGLDSTSLAAPLAYINSRGETWTYPLWEMLYHLLNHQSYHRGQVSTLLRLLGAQPAAVDFLNARDEGGFTRI